MAWTGRWPRECTMASPVALAFFGLFVVVLVLLLLVWSGVLGAGPALIVAVAVALAGFLLRALTASTDV